VLVHHCPHGPSKKTIVYSATVKRIHGMGLTTVKYDTLLDTTHEFPRQDCFHAIDEHSRAIADRIGGRHRVIGLSLSWGLDLIEATIDSDFTTKASPLTNVEKKYLYSQQVARLWRKDFYSEQDGRIVDFGSQPDCL
jgi:hypothetical protein